MDNNTFTEMGICGVSLPQRRILVAAAAGVLIVLLVALTRIHHPLLDAMRSERAMLPSPASTITVAAAVGSPAPSAGAKCVVAVVATPSPPSVSSLDAPALSPKPPSAAPSLDPPHGLPGHANWTFAASAPGFCHALAERFLPNNGCHRDKVTQRCSDDNSTRLNGQFMQDRYLYLGHFRHLRRRGVYLDVAANEAAEISNTFFFDRCLGWDGLCVEPNPRYHPDLRALRSCALEPTCLSDVEGQQVDFLLAEGLSGIAETNKRHRDHTMHNLRGHLNLTCRRADNVLRDWNVTKVDYLSLDVEGHELKILQSIDWAVSTFEVITIEVTQETLWQLEPFLASKGYLRHYPLVDGRRRATLGEDVIFLNENVTFGYPR